MLFMGQIFPSNKNDLLILKITLFINGFIFKLLLLIQPQFQILISANGSPFAYPYFVMFLISLIFSKTFPNTTWWSFNQGVFAKVIKN